MISGSFGIGKVNALFSGSGNGIAFYHRLCNAVVKHNSYAEGIGDLVVLNDAAGFLNKQPNGFLNSGCFPVVNIFDSAHAAEFAVTDCGGASIQHGEALWTAALHGIRCEYALGVAHTQERPAVLGGTPADRDFFHVEGVHTVVENAPEGTPADCDTGFKSPIAVIVGSDAACHVLKRAVFHIDILCRKACAVVERKKVKMQSLLGKHAAALYSDKPLKGTVFYDGFVHACEHNVMVRGIFHFQSAECDVAGALNSYRLGFVACRGSVGFPDSSAYHNVCQGVIAHLCAVASLKHTSQASAIAQYRFRRQFKSRVRIDEKALTQRKRAVCKCDCDRTVFCRVVAGKIQCQLNGFSVVLCVAAVCSEVLRGHGCSAADGNPEHSRCAFHLVVARIRDKAPELIPVFQLRQCA